jgi:cobalt-zinc-cadmium efflux system membrane fusion protein
MKPRPLLILLITILLGASAVYLTWRHARPTPTARTDDHAHPEAAGPPPGPHGGRLLSADDFTLELALREHGQGAEFLAYPRLAGQPVPPAQVELTLTLTRLGGRVEVLRCLPEGDHLRSQRDVSEPHSFHIRVVARHADREYSWDYEALEGRVELNAAAAARAGVVVSEAAPAILRQTLPVAGRIRLNEDTLARVVPRYAGLVRSVSKRTGDPVAAGEVLAVVEANDSLQTYEVRAPRAGMVLTRTGAEGTFAPAGEALYTLADLSTVWLDLFISRSDAPMVRTGQTVTVNLPGLPESRASITALLPWSNVESQSVLARVELPNPRGVWRPGLVVQAAIHLGEHAAPVAVPAAALQTIGTRTVVFRNEGDLYEAQPVTIGRRDGDLVEITAGLEPGMRYVTGNSFLIKAELLKSGASHDH